MIYRYLININPDLLVNNMIGNSKNIDLEEKVSIKPIREEDLKIFSDLLKTPLDTCIGEEWETSQPCQKLWSHHSSLLGFSVFWEWKHILFQLIKLTNNYLNTERTYKEVKEEWKDSTEELHLLPLTSGTLSSDHHWLPTKSKSIQLGDKT